MGPHVFKPGDRCGGCEVVGFLGSGGFAEVYEVVDPSGARRALKTLATDADARPKLRARLAQEGSALAMIEHVNVVRLFEAGFHDDRIFLILELVRGQTLREATHAAGGRVDPRTLSGWIQQVSEGVAAAHAVGVVHRDLKPENVLLTVTELAKVIDFGIAKLSTSGVKTTSDQRVGTAMYMAPEHMQKKSADPRMDQYSLGLVLYEALTGTHPIVPAPATFIEICARQMNHRPRPLVIEAPWVPADFAAIVDRAIEKDPERRFPTMRAFADALRDAHARMPAVRASAPDNLSLGSTSPNSAITSSPPSSLSRSFGGTAPLPSELVRGQMHLAPTADLSASAPIAATREMAGTRPLGTTAPGTESARVPTITPTTPSPILQPTMPSPITLQTMPSAIGPAPTSTELPSAKRSRVAPAKIAVAAIAMAIGLGGGVVTAIQIEGAWRAPKAKTPAPSAKPPPIKKP